MSREQLSYLLRLVKGGMLERATTMIEQELAKPESINHAAWHWHNLYQAKCQEFHDKQTILGTEIVALEEELAELKEEQLDKPEQEPVAWVKSTASGYNVVGYESNVINKLSNETPLYTAPPRKEWVGLTDDDHQDFADRTKLLPILAKTLAEFIEAKLKELNT